MARRGEVSCGWRWRGAGGDGDYRDLPCGDGEVRVAMATTQSNPCTHLVVVGNRGQVRPRWSRSEKGLGRIALWHGRDLVPSGRGRRTSPPRRGLVCVSMSSRAWFLFFVKFHTHTLRKSLSFCWCGIWCCAVFSGSGDIVKVIVSMRSVCTSTPCSTNRILALVVGAPDDEDHQSFRPPFGLPWPDEEDEGPPWAIVLAGAP